MQEGKINKTKNIKKGKLNYFKPYGDQPYCKITDRLVEELFLVKTRRKMGVRENVKRKKKNYKYVGACKSMWPM